MFLKMIGLSLLLFSVLLSLSVSVSVSVCLSLRLPPFPAISALALAALVLPGSYTHYLDLISALSVGPYLIGLAKFGLAFPVSFHTFNGIRHLVRETLTTPPPPPPRRHRRLSRYSEPARVCVSRLYGDASDDLVF